VANKPKPRGASNKDDETNNDNRGSCWCDDRLCGVCTKQASKQASKQSKNNQQGYQYPNNRKHVD
jgi:hypothetical protein